MIVDDFVTRYGVEPDETCKFCHETADKMITYYENEKQVLDGIRLPDGEWACANCYEANIMFGADLNYGWWEPDF